jgi:hypothetical protein
MNFAEMLITALIKHLLNALFILILWNWLMPDIFRLGQIDYWQAIGLNLCLWTLFTHSKQMDNNE